MGLSDGTQSPIRTSPSQAKPYPIHDRSAFPDVHATIEDLLADGDKVIERTTARATSKGTFNGISPTGKPVLWTEIHIYRLRGGRIDEHWGEIDFLGLMTQLGAIPPPK